METLGRDGSKEILLVGKMAIGGRRRYAHAPGRLAQSNRLQAVLVQNLAGRGQ
jgi:hypothetical protein